LLLSHDPAPPCQDLTNVRIIRTFSQKRAWSQLLWVALKPSPGFEFASLGQIREQKESSYSLAGRADVAAGEVRRQSGRAEREREGGARGGACEQSARAGCAVGACGGACEQTTELLQNIPRLCRIKRLSDKLVSVLRHY